MPQLGETVKEGTVLRWLRSPGESITEHEPLLEIATDKVDTEIPAPATGVLAEIVVSEHSTVSVGTVLAVIASEATAQPRRRHIHSPRVRKRAMDAGIALTSLHGSGPNSRVTIADLEAAILAASSELVGEEPSPTAVRVNELPAAAASIVEADVTDLTSLCCSPRWNDVGSAFMAHVLHALTGEMQAHPNLNSHVSDGASPNSRAQLNLGILATTPRGLAVRVVRDANDLNVQGIARRLDELAKAAHAETEPSPLSAGAMFTVADAGSRALLVDIPSLSLGQLAALTVGSVVERPAVVRDSAGAAAIAVRSTVFLTLAYDPRRIGAAEAAQFLSNVKERLQHPLQAAS